MSLSCRSPLIYSLISPFPSQTTPRVPGPHEVALHPSRRAPRSHAGPGFPGPGSCWWPRDPICSCKTLVPKATSPALGRVLWELRSQGQGRALANRLDWDLSPGLKEQGSPPSPTPRVLAYTQTQTPGHNKAKQTSEPWSKTKQNKKQKQKVNK